MFDLHPLIARASAWLTSILATPAPREVPLFPLPPVDPARVVAAVGRSLGALAKDITSGDRHHGAVRARHAAALTLRRLGLSYPQIAVVIRWDNHASAIHAVKRAETRMAEPAFAAAVEAGMSAARGGT